MASDTPATSCHAPFTSLYLDPRGFVRVCAVNNGVPLGNVGRTSLLDIWRGATAEGLRNEFRSGGWGTGCEVCQWQASPPGPDHSFARTFDHLAEDSDAPTWPRRIEFALGNTCNLRCVMCSGDLSSSIRSRQEGFDALPEIYDDRFFADLEVMAPHLREARFLGGEPFMIPAHHRVWELLATVDPRPSVHVTTNGTIWNQRVEEVLDRFDTSLAVSVDGMRPETVEAIRVGADHGALEANIDRFVAYTRDRGTHFGLTYCLMTENWREFGDFCAWGDELDVDVFVNVVSMPSRFSLLRLPERELEQVVDALDDERGPGGDGLGRNRSVWVDQLRQLRSAMASAADGTSIDWWKTTAARLCLDDDAPIVATDIEELREWSVGGPIAVLELDDRDRIVAADPTETVLDVPLDAAGRGFDELVVLLSSFYGRRTDIAWVRRRPELEDRTARYETAHAVTDLRSISRLVEPDRVRITLAARGSSL